VLYLLRELDSKGVVYWLDGGWGVDCLWASRRGPHGDVDLVLHRDHLAAVRELLTTNGYEVVRDWLPTSLAFRGPAGREVDLHLVDPSPDGGGHQMLQDGTQSHYSPPVEGYISGVKVRCASAKDQLAMHQDYDPRPIDYVDVRRISDRFGLEPPAAI
jgi:lincosamide nucleotidyltransferase A/C/D/E